MQNSRLPPMHTQEMAMLRIHDGGFWRLTEEACVEPADVVQRAAGLNIPWVAQRGGVHPGGEQFRVVQRPNAFDAGTKLSPILCDVAATRKSARHANDGNIGRRGSVRSLMANLQVVELRPLLRVIGNPVKTYLGPISTSPSLARCKLAQADRCSNLRNHGFGYVRRAEKAPAERSGEGHSA